MKVKLIRPPAVQNKVRGIGFYGSNLMENLNNIAGLNIVDSGQDITHYLYFDLFFLTLPVVRKTKTVVTVFDLTPIVLKNLFIPGIRGEIKWEIQKRILSGVNAIITISESAKNDIVKYVGYPKDKIFVTYLAPGKECRPLKLERNNEVLYIGDINANKNLSVLFKAISLLKDRKLILIGKAISESEKIRSEIKNLGIEDKVVFKGFVSEEEKVQILNKVSIYVQPSIYEGFGLPVLEAMACGTPVICGKNSSLPEIAGDAATYADVLNPNDLVEKIENARTTGREVIQAKKFSWEKTAAETYEVYKKVLA